MAFLFPGGNNAATLFEIRLDKNYVVFRGSEDEAASAHMQGSVVLCLAESLTIKYLKLSFCGINRISWPIGAAPHVNPRKWSHKERCFFERVWTFRDPGKSKVETLPPGNYEFPFDIVLEGTMPESIEGLEHTWLKYRFQAEIGRKFQKDIVIRKPLRIVRTLDVANALEISHAMCVENTWVDKIDYSISTPSKAVTFGTALQVDFRLVPLLKGLVMGTVKTQVKEEHEHSVDWDFGGLSAGNLVHKWDRIVAEDEYVVDPEADAQILNEEAEGYQFSRFLELPKSLKSCLQDCNIKGVKVRHKIKFNVQLHNPDGHVSELRANLPVTFYLSPALPLDENDELVDQTPHADRQALANEDIHAAPPLYGQHRLDQLFSDLSLTGYHTPAGHSSSTTPYSLSRNISSENVTHFEPPTNLPVPISSSPSNHNLNPAALRSRLQNLRGSPVNAQSPLVNEQTSPENTGPSPADRNSNQGDYFCRTGSSGHLLGQSPNMPNSILSVPDGEDVSRRTSAEASAETTDLVSSGAHTPQGQYYHAEDLSRVPSYSTAVRTPVPRTSVDSGLPSYFVTTSAAAPSEPPNAYLRDQPLAATRQVRIVQSEERRLRNGGR